MPEHITPIAPPERSVPVTPAERTGRPRDPLIDVRGLVKTYPGGVRAVDGVSFAVAPGSVFALLGPNGAGKSTTIKVLTTLSRADGGEVRVAGIDVRRDPQRVRRAIGVVAQRSGVDLEATARENLVLQGRVHGLDGAELRARVDALMEQMRLVDAADRLVRTFSGGMQRRLDIAMALVHRPRVLFLDEPTTGLDPEIRASLWREISRLAREDGLTVLLTTHYLEEADALAERVAIVDRGRLVAEGTPEGLKSELHGDAIEVVLTRAHPPGRIQGALHGIDGLGDVVVDGASVSARAAAGAEALPAVLAALESDGVGVASVTVARPSLADVYLRRVGHRFDHETKEDGR